MELCWANAIPEGFSTCFVVVATLFQTIFASNATNMVDFSVPDITAFIPSAFYTFLSISKPSEVNRGKRKLGSFRTTVQGRSVGEKLHAILHAVTERSLSIRVVILSPYAKACLSVLCPIPPCRDS